MNIPNRMMHQSLKLLLAALFLSITGCAVTGGKPDWVDNPDAMYPDLIYLTGLGEGEDMESAAATATASLSAVFASQVNATTRVNERLEESAQNALMTSVTNIDVAIHTAQQIEGVQINERWQDSSGRHYALAVLERDEASRDLADRLRSNEQALRTKMSLANTQATPLERFRALIPAAELAAERDVWAAQYRVLSNDFWNAAPTTASVDNALAAALAETVFVVRAQTIEEASGRTTQNPTFAKAIGEVVNETGFTVGQANEGRLLALARITLSAPFERGNNKWTHYLWDVSLELTEDDPAARAFLIVEDSGSASHPDSATAKRAAIGQAEKAILEIFNDEFSAYLRQPAQTNGKSN